MNRLEVHAEVQIWPLTNPFRITGYNFDDVRVMVVRLKRGGHVGRGEAHGVYYKNETAASMLEQVESVRAIIESGIDREALRKSLPAGGARNALDCALWDLEAKSSGKTIWELTGVTPRATQTVFTLGMEDTPELLAMRATEAAAYPTLKIKVDSDRPVARVTAVRAARPDAKLIVDANQGWSFDQLVAFAPGLADLGVSLIEQPLPRGQDEQLEGYASPIRLSGDESCQNLGELDVASRRYQFVNIKLDKVGGLTEALTLAKEARKRGIGTYAGCMCGTSLSMAPAFVLAQGCEYVELDGHLLLARDRDPSILCERGLLSVPDRRLWG